MAGLPAELLGDGRLRLSPGAGADLVAVEVRVFFERVRVALEDPGISAGGLALQAR